MFRASRSEAVHHQCAPFHWVAIRLDSASLSITAQWLREHADQAGGHASRLHYRESLPEQKALFREAFEDQRTLPSRVKQVYETFHTDDYPHMQATLVLQSGVQVRQMMGILGSDPVNRLESLLCGNLVSPDFLTQLKDISVRE